MANSLSELGFAGRSDIIPGYVLCKPRTYIEGAEAEKIATTWFIETVATSVKGLDAKLAEVILLSAKQDILEGKLRYKSWGFNRWALAPASLIHLLILTTRQKHANTVTPAMAAQWLIDFDADKIAMVVHELFGYEMRKPTRWRLQMEPIDWEAVLKRLISPSPEGLGMPIDQVKEMTDQQLAALLGAEPDPDRKRLESTYAWFEAICDASGKDPVALHTMDDAELSTWMKFTEPTERKGKTFNVVLVRPFLAKYLTACS